MIESNPMKDTFHRIPYGRQRGPVDGKTNLMNHSNNKPDE
jgi:hypothetical protein